MNADKAEVGIEEAMGSLRDREKPTAFPAPAILPSRPVGPAPDGGPDADTQFSANLALLAVRCYRRFYGR